MHKKIIKKVKNVTFFDAFAPILLTFLSLPTLVGLWGRGFFVSDDGEWMIIRLAAFYEVLKAGQLPARFLTRLNDGYGYPVSNFLYPGYLYIGTLINIIGFDFITTIKIIFGLSIIFSGICMYFWLKYFFGKAASFFGALIYVYFPYHLYDLYKRGSIGEILALAVVPFILWQIERRSFFWTSIGVGLLLISHNILAFLFLPVIMLYIFLRKNPQRIFFSLILGVFLSSFFWIPALYELQYTNFLNTKISDWNNYFASSNMTNMLIIILFLSGFFIVGKFLKNKKDFFKSHTDSRVLFFLFLGGISLYLSHSASFVVWKVLPVNFIQFPFRYLSLTLICAGFLSSFIVSQFKSYLKISVGIILTLGVVFYSYPYFLNVERIYNPDEYYISNQATTTIKDEYMPYWVKEKPTNYPDKKAQLLEGNGVVENIISRPNNTSFDTTVNSPTATIQFNTIYYPGWKLYVNKREEQIRYDNSQGVMRVKLPKGSYKINYLFTETPIRLFANILTVISFITLLAISIRKVNYYGKKISL